MTIRRDLEVLESSGLVRRVHGGAVSGWNRGYEPAFSLRAAHNGDAKARIGKRCAELIEEGETLFLDIGTTTLAAAHALADRRGITVITPNLRVADILVDLPGIRVICLGGIIRAGERCATGVIAERNLAEFFFDTCIVGVAGVSLQAGLTEFNVDDASLKRTAIDHARRLIVLADQSKLGQIALATVAPLGRISTLITDADEANDTVAGTRRAGAAVELV
jgi:DeoR/GlpR family transcriptional regulator of sugar metabolism